MATTLNHHTRPAVACSSGAAHVRPVTLVTPLTAAAMPAPARVPSRLSSRQGTLPFSGGGGGSSGAGSAPTNDGGFELVWDGPRPRMRRKLHMASATAEPDFEMAKSRAASTARRLGLSGLPTRSLPSRSLPMQPPSPLSAARAASAALGAGRGVAPAAMPGYMASRSTLSSSIGRLGTAPAAQSPPRLNERWLAEPDLDMQVATKVADVVDYIRHDGPDARSKAIAEFYGPWGKPALTVDWPRLQLQKPVALEQVMAAKQAAEEARRAAEASAAARVAQVSHRALADSW